MSGVKGHKRAKGLDGLTDLQRKMVHGTIANPNRDKAELYKSAGGMCKNPAAGAARVLENDAVRMYLHQYRVQLRKKISTSYRIAKYKELLEAKKTVVSKGVEPYEVEDHAIQLEALKAVEKLDGNYQEPAQVINQADNQIVIINGSQNVSLRSENDQG